MWQIALMNNDYGKEKQCKSSHMKPRQSLSKPCNMIDIVFAAPNVHCPDFKCPPLLDSD